MFELREVTKRYGDRAAIDGVTLRIEPRAVTVLIGPSGCGKSTLVRLMLALIAPDSGVVQFDGRPLEAGDLTALRRRVGYVIQGGGLFPHLTSRDNVTLVSRHLGWERERIAHRVAELAELTRFPPDGLDRFPLELSGGQRQRVALMRALMLDPDVLLLDEPLGALDPMIRFDLQSDLKTVFAGLRKTVVLVTHDLPEADFLGDRIVLLRDGRIVQEGGLEQMVTRPAEPFVTRFVTAQNRRAGNAGSNRS